MKQARVLTDAEFKRLLAVVVQMKHANRNRLALGEIATLTVRDVIDGEGKVREQLRLRAEITKGGHACVVFLNEKLRREIERYHTDWPEDRDVDAPFLLTQKQTAFSENTLCLLMGQLYRSAGLDRATSHSGHRWFITRLVSLEGKEQFCGVC